MALGGQKPESRVERAFQYDYPVCIYLGVCDVERPCCFENPCLASGGTGHSRLVRREVLDGTMANPYVFIVGCPRSGTTLLGRMLNAHPQIAITRESHWIPRLFEERKELTPEGLVTSQLIPRLLEDPRFTRWQVDHEKLEALLATGQPVPYPQFVAHIFDLYGELTAKALVGNKTPWFVRRLLLLHSLSPTARFVHLIRDGRDVCLSMVPWSKGPIV